MSLPSRDAIYADLVRQGLNPTPEHVELNLLALRMQRARKGNGRQWVLFICLALAAVGLTYAEWMGALAWTVIGAVSFYTMRGTARKNIAQWQATAVRICHEAGIPLSQFWATCLGSDPYYEGWVEVSEPPTPT